MHYAQASWLSIAARSSVNCLFLSSAWRMAPLLSCSSLPATAAFARAIPGVIHSIMCQGGSQVLKEGKVERSLSNKKEHILLSSTSVLQNYYHAFIRNIYQWTTIWSALMKMCHVQQAENCGGKWYYLFHPLGKPITMHKRKVIIFVEKMTNPVC